MRSVLISGGAGFIGFHLAKFHAARGDAIFLLDNFSKPAFLDAELEAFGANEFVKVLKHDLCMPVPPECLPSHLDNVYHLAAINGTALFYEIPYAVAKINLLSTINLLELLESKSVGRLLYSSSSEVYAGGERFGLLKVPSAEDAPVVFPQPTDTRFSYATSKFMGEFLCFHFGRKFSVPTTVVRYHNVYGPRMGELHVVPQLIRRILSDERPLVIAGARDTRAFCYVDDAIRATYLAVQSSKADQEVLHVGNSADEIFIARLAERIMAALERHIPVVEAPSPEASVSRRCPDTTKLHRLTGFIPEVDLETGLARTCKWYLDYYRRHYGLPDGSKT